MVEQMRCRDCATTSAATYVVTITGDGTPAVVVCRMCDDRRRTAPVGGRRFYQHPLDRTLAELRGLTASVVELGGTPSMVLGRVGEALTGRSGGPVERALARELTATYDAVRTREEGGGPWTT